MNRDPIGFAGGLNLFEYAGSSPIQYFDPLGLELHSVNFYATGQPDQDLFEDPADTTLILAVIAGLVVAPSAVGSGVAYGSTYLPMGYQLGIGGSTTYFIRWLSQRPDVQEGLFSGATGYEGPSPAPLLPMASAMHTKSCNGVATWYNSNGLLTTGTYRIDPIGQLRHTNGNLIEKSQFFFKVNADELVLQAAEFAERHNLWFDNKAKVKVNELIGVVSRTGEPSDYVNVWRRSSIATSQGMPVHGAPGTPP